MGDACGVFVDARAGVEVGQFGHIGAHAGPEDGLLRAVFGDVFPGAAVMVGIFQQAVYFRFGCGEDGTIARAAAASALLYSS